MTATTDVKEVKTLALTDLYVAAFLLAKGHRLTRVDDSQPWKVEFHFSRLAKTDTDAFYGGGTIEGRVYAAALRDLKAILARKRREGDGT